MEDKTLLDAHGEEYDISLVEYYGVRYVELDTFGANRSKVFLMADEVDELIKVLQEYKEALAHERNHNE
jgi:hypothetical protein